MRTIIGHARARIGRFVAHSGPMRRALVLSIPLYLAVPIVYALGIVALGWDLQLGPLLAGAAGWLVALVLRAPVGLAGFRITGSTERAQRWVVASSGPLEESVRLAVLLLVGRDLGTALWIGLGWAAIEVLYAIANGFAIEALARRTDPEAERARALLPPAAVGGHAPWWGVAERVWTTAVHIGFTLILAAIPPLVVVTAAVHSAINVAFLWLASRRGLLLTTLAGSAAGGAILLFGLWLSAV
jgi:hypothetical protein